MDIPQELRRRLLGTTEIVRSVPQLKRPRKRLVDLKRTNYLCRMGQEEFPEDFEAQVQQAIREFDHVLREAGYPGIPPQGPKGW